MNIIKRSFNFLKGKLVYRKFTKDFKNLYLGRIIINSATQLMGLFLPIFLYQFLAHSVSLVVFYYLILDLSYLFLVVPACRYFINNLGIKSSLRISIFFGAIYYLFLFFLNHNLGIESALSTTRILYLIPVMFFSLMFRLTHWVPFHTNVAKLTDKVTRARQISFLEATMLALGAIMPLISGVILSILGYGHLFLVAIFIYILSYLPFSLLPEMKERFTWTYKQTWKKLFSKKLRPTVIAYMGDGAEGIVGSVIWPIFIWLLLDGDYFQVALISSVIIAVTIILQILVGRFMDSKGNRSKILKYGTGFYSLGWILKALIGSSFQVFLFSTYHNLSRVFSRTSFDVINYDIAADQGRYTDEYTAIREMSILLGKVIMAVFIIILLPYFDLRLVFVLAALASLSMSLLKQGGLIGDEDK